MTQDLYLYSFLVFVAAVFGGMLPLKKARNHQRWLKLSISFGAGILLGVSILHMLPEAVLLVGVKKASVMILAGFVFLMTLERFVMVHSCDEGGCHYHTVGMTAFLGLSVHSLVEGVAMASAGPALSSVFLAVLLHKGPSAYALSSLLVMAHKKPKYILGVVFLMAAATPFGILAGHYLLNELSYPSLSGVMVALATGTFLYISACDLLPEVHKGQNQATDWARLLCFFGGLSLSFV